MMVARTGVMFIAFAMRSQGLLCFIESQRFLRDWMVHLANEQKNVTKNDVLRLPYAEGVVRIAISVHVNPAPRSWLSFRQHRLEPPLEVLHA